MATVGVYNAHFRTLGGGELYTLHLVRTLLRAGHQVELLSTPGASIEAAAERFGVSVDAASVPVVGLDPSRHNLEAEERSADYDLFCNLTHNSRTHSRAGRGVLLPWFPGRDRNLDQVASYDRVVTTSHYAQYWTGVRWGVDSSVVPPAVRRVQRGEVDQGRSIVVLGRFQVGSHPKRQLELVRTFGAALEAGRLEGWTMSLVGGGTEPEYVDAVREAAVGLPVTVEVDAPRAVVERRLRAADVLWQATGWHCSPSEEPERFEHFGIGLVEAMSAGVVPVALRTGGPQEIVRSGRDGELWSEDEGPIAATERLAASPQRLREMSRSARRRARRYSRKRFEEALLRVVEPLLEGHRPRRARQRSMSRWRPLT